LSDIFRNYLIIVGGCLTAAGVVLALLTWVGRRNMRSVWAIYRSWLVMIPVIALCVYFGRIPTITLVTVLTVAAFWEFARVTHLLRDRGMTLAVLIGIAATSTTSFMESPHDGQPGWLPMFLAMPVYAIGLIFVVPILRNRSKGQLRVVSLAIVAYLYLCWMFGHLGQIANSQYAEGYLLFLFFAVESNDIAAFTFGRLLGRNPLRSEISPKKTWEGAIGALAISLMMPWLLGFSFPEGFGTLQKVLAGLIVGIGGQLGDLSISFIKRDLEVKDMGTAIPGHGGVLDRIDSLIFTSPFFFHMLNYFELL
jgi:phosphatidate cytidylyltransferase